MNKQQTMHVGMMNSYNILMDKVSLDTVVQSGVGIFAHVPDEEPRLDDIEMMIIYFQDHDMFEICSDLVKYIEENYNQNGSLKGSQCDCEYPTLKEYTRKMKCATCNKRLRK
jgi:hypothetical protein